MTADSKTRKTTQEVRDLLKQVQDPELPGISIVDLGMVREVCVAGHGSVRVDITPTYSGCPALKLIEDQVLAVLAAGGFSNVVMNTVFSPAWTTDWLSDDAAAKLRTMGIAPPGPVPAERPQRNPLLRLRVLPADEPVPCPWCGSSSTALRSRFGATACKALHYCDGCQQPFEHFKPL
ncbi:MAG: phenylacetate-CoA oxygenase subunit PaaJ [Proteobacteria bacterium]|nr:phenylacetate-CoA oxygenase subunit PaaJ [Pseudomonadota bacterium]